LALESGFGHYETNEGILYQVLGRSVIALRKVQRPFEEPIILCREQVLTCLRVRRFGLKKPYGLYYLSFLKMSCVRDVFIYQAFSISIFQKYATSYQESQKYFDSQGIRRIFLEHIDNNVLYMKRMESRSAASLTPENLYRAKYNWLFGWAMHFAQGDRVTAEDLVQDTFVRFALSKPDLENVRNAEALLYTYLKYVHLAHLRRLQRYPFKSLSIAEFDSVQLGLRANMAAVDPVEVQETLRRIVAYLTWRKESAKSASMLILRYFHGYYPDEIVCIARTTRQSVGKRLQEAREEAELYVSDPGHLRIMHQTEPPEVLPLNVALPSEQVLPELQKIIFAACRTECLPENLLFERYQAENSKPIERELLAHIVSCERCLGLVSDFCGMAPPADRSPEESLGPDRRGRRESKENTSPSGDNIRRTLKFVRDRVREVYEHRPRQLAISVNGSILATQDVNSPWSRQEIKLSPETHPEFIEVVSEQSVCLLALHVASTPPDALPELHQEVELSHGRRIEARLQFTSVGALLEVSYYDPSFAADAEEAAEEADDESSPQLSEQTTNDRPAKIIPYRSWWSCGRAWVGKLAVPKFNPAYALATAFALVIVALLVLWPKGASEPSANDLLARAVAAHTEGTTAAQPGVVCQKVRIRTSRRTLERTIYRDAQGLRQPKPEQLTPEDAQLQTNLAVANVGWDEPLSPSTYKDWHDRQKSPTDEVKRSGNGLLTLTTTAASGAIARESLTVRERDFHPIERTVEFRDAETVEIAEVDYNVLPWSAPRESLFGPPTRNLVSDASRNSVSLPLLTKTELDEAELQARLALNQLHADTDGRIEVVRKPTGIQIRGIVESEQRKRELQARLSSLPHVRLSISTLWEMAARPASRSAITRIKADSQTAQPSPLEAYLTSKGRSWEEINQLSRRLLDSSSAIHQEGKALSELSRRFAADTPLSNAAQSALYRLIASHQAKLLVALQTEDNILAGTGAPPLRAATLSSSGEVSLAMSAKQNRALCEELTLGSVATKSQSSAELKIAEVQKSINQIRATALHITANFQTIHRFNAQH
jgi:DNA-directed RNA polymerase specialized sigma24 family protein